MIKGLKQFAPTNATVLIHGENGTGKELVAKAMHTNSPRKNKPFVAMNCAALNENLLDDEMFGHEAGAFTGADKTAQGALRVRQRRHAVSRRDRRHAAATAGEAAARAGERRGDPHRSNEPIKVNVRLIAATNRDLEQVIKDGKFRQDLYYRLKVGLDAHPAAARTRRGHRRYWRRTSSKEFAERHGKKVPRRRRTRCGRRSATTTGPATSASCAT